MGRFALRAAIGVGMVGRGEVWQKGVLPPEKAFAPDAFFDRLAPFCQGSPSGSQHRVRVVTAETGFASVET